MSEQIKVAIGTKTYDLVDKDGKMLGQITFNPSDTNIIERHAEVMRRLHKLEEEFRKSVRKTTVREDIAELDSIVYQQIDYLLNADVSKTIFSIMGPFSPLSNGQLFVENIMDAIGKIIQAEATNKSEIIKKKISKHTAKYHK